jgi:hypothetical protein
LSVATCLFCGAGNQSDVVEYGRNPNEKGWPEEHCFKGKLIVLCSHCGGGFLEDAPDDDEIAGFYEAVYRRSGDGSVPRISDLHEFSPRFLSQVVYLKSFIPLPDGMRILEIGPNVVSALPSLSLLCRPHYFYFDQLDSTIIGYFGGNRLGAYATPGAIDTHFAGDKLDLIYASHSVEHLNPRSVDDLFAALGAALRSGGHMFIEVPYDLGGEEIYPPHTLFFTPESLRQFMMQHGFEVVDLAMWEADGSRQPNAPISPGARTCSSMRPRPGVASRLKCVLRQSMLGIPALERALRPLRVRRGLPRALRALPTPYDPRPYIRVIGRKA